MKTKRCTIIPIITFIIGLILEPTAANLIDNIFKKPKVSCSIECLNIFQGVDNRMRLEVYLKLRNSGKSNTSISLNDLNLQFDGINDKPYQFDIKRNISINGLSYVNDTIILFLPQELDTLSNIPILKQMEVRHNEIDKNKLVSTIVDNSNVVYKAFVGKVYPLNPDSFSYTPDYIVNNGVAKIIFRKIPITYHGKTYTNMLFPREANISYKIKDGKIFVEYNYVNNLKEGQSEFLMKPIFFIPAPELEDYIVLPDGYELNISYESIENKIIKIKEYSVKIGNNSKQIVYFINQKNNAR